MQREYKFLAIPYARYREGLVLERDHHEVIREHARSGWELVQIVDFSHAPSPHLECIFVLEGDQQ